MSAAVDTDSRLVEYYGRLDGNLPGEPLELLADDFEFSMDLIGEEVEGGHQHFSGGREQMRGYVDNRPPGRSHHLARVSAAGGTEVALGVVREDGEFLALFLASIQTGADGKIVRYLVSRHSALPFELEV